MSIAPVLDLDANIERQEFEKILYGKLVRCAFQPIISLRDASIFGYEALARGPKGSVLEKPEAIFRQAEAAHKLWDVEYLFRYAALKAAHALPRHTKLFLNVNPNIIHHDKFQQGVTTAHLKDFGLKPDQILFEITERESVFDMSAFRTIIAHYKSQGYKIAIDDVGAGYSGLNLIAEIQPHCIKLDMQLVRNIDKEPVKQAIVKSMCEFAALTSAFVIAEGVETYDELCKLITLDVGYAQGYLIQRPSESIRNIDDGLKQYIIRENKHKNRFFGMHANDFYVKNISNLGITISEDMVAKHIATMFNEQNTLFAVCVVRAGYPVGLITRGDFFQSLSGNFGYALFSEKPVCNIMATTFLQVDAHTTIDVVARKALLRTPDKLYDAVVITREGKYCGIVTIKDLLEKTLELEVANAKQINPLSELPGNVAIETHITKAVMLEENKCILYFDLDNFKAYNDFYGFERGDGVLKCVTRILKEQISSNAFLGHIGGDDFIAIVAINTADSICQCIIDIFDAKVKAFYSDEDGIRGYINVKNRNAVEECFPLMSISIVGVYSSHYKTTDILAEDAGRLKKLCKQQPGSNYMLKQVQPMSRESASEPFTQ